MFLSAALAVSVSAQTRGGISAREFFLFHLRCEHHDPSVDKALQVVGITIGPAAPPKTRSVATVELRNSAVKTITAFVFTKRRGATGWYLASGEDFLYD